MPAQHKPLASSFALWHHILVGLANDHTLKDIARDEKYHINTIKYHVKQMREHYGFTQSIHTIAIEAVRKGVLIVDHDIDTIDTFVTFLTEYLEDDMDIASIRNGITEWLTDATTIYKAIRYLDSTGMALSELIQPA